MLELQKEGYVIPPLPVAIIEAANYEEAGRSLAVIVSQYGVVDAAGLTEFIDNFNITLPDFKDLEIPSINMDQFEKVKFGEDDDDASGETEEKETSKKEDRYMIVIECESEAQLHELEKELEERKFKCKVIS